MFKLLAFLALFLPSVIGTTTSPDSDLCTCPSVPSLEKTAQTSNSITYAWGNAYTGAQSRVGYVRQEDNYTSGYFYTSNLSFCFTGLSAGHYTFYFQTQCEAESSAWIGIEDTIVM